MCQALFQALKLSGQPSKIPTLMGLPFSWDGERQYMNAEINAQYHTIR